MRRAGKVDHAQQTIVTALRISGMQVQSLASVGAGVPDLLVAWRGRNFLLEVKTGTRECDRKLTLAEQVWHSSWPGQVAIVSTPDEAVEVVLNMSRQYDAEDLRERMRRAA